MAVWCTSNKNKKKHASQPLQSSAGCPNQPDHSAVCGGQGALKAVKALWGLSSRPILDQGFHYANVNTQKRKEVVRKPRRSYCSLRQFCGNAVWTLWGQKSSLMNKKGLKGLPYSPCKHAYVRHLEKKKKIEKIFGLWIMCVNAIFRWQASKSSVGPPPLFCSVKVIPHFRRLRKRQASSVSHRYIINSPTSPTTQLP